jgi:hypothetical protein
LKPGKNFYFFSQCTTGVNRNSSSGIPSSPTSRVLRQEVRWRRQIPKVLLFVGALFLPLFERVPAFGAPNVAAVEASAQEGIAVIRVVVAIAHFG